MTLSKSSAEPAAKGSGTAIANAPTTTTTTTARPPERATGGGLSACLTSLPPWSVTLTVAACVLMEVTLGVSYTTANLMPYMTSYMRNVTEDTSVDYGKMLWVYTSSWLVVSSILSVLGLLERRIPNRIYAFSGVCLNAAALFGTYWAIQTSFAALVIVNGIIQGFAQAILYPNSLNLALKWFPQHKGMVSGLTMGGYGGGAFIWNQVVTKWINPHNLQPDLVDGENRYFTQPELLSRVPSCFLLLGGVLISIQLVCIFVVIYPDPKAPHPTQHTVPMATYIEPENKEAMLDSGRVDSMPGKCSLGLADSAPEKNTPQSIFVDSTPESGVAGATSEKTTPESGPVLSTPHSECVDSTSETCTSHSDRVNLVREQHTTGSKVRSITANHGEGENWNGRTSLRPSDDDITHGQGHADTSLVIGSPLVRIPEYSLLGILQLQVTWTLWLNNLCIDYAFLFIVAFYKAYGQTFIANDHLLALVASVASVFNAVGRPIWGLVADRLGYLPTMLLIQSLLVVTSATFLTCELVGSAAMFFVWVCAMFAAFSGIYSLQGPIVFSLYGPRNFIFALGVIATTGVISTLTAVPIADAMLAAFGWKGIYPLTASLVFIGILILSSLLLPCGRPMAPHMRAGLMVPVRRAKARRSQQQQLHEDTLV